MQIGQFESVAHLPTLDALDAEFRCEDEQRATERGATSHHSGEKFVQFLREIEKGASMDSAFSRTQSEFAAHLEAARPETDAKRRPSLDPITKRPSLGRRASRRLARFLVVFCIGVAATVAWQSYGDAARAMIANSSPQLGWLAPQTAVAVPTAPNVMPPAAAASPELQQLALGLASVRQTVEQLAVQLAAGQQQMAGDIAKLQADEQQILHKLSAAPPRPPAAPAHKPTPVTQPPSSSEQAR